MIAFHNNFVSVSNDLIWLVGLPRVRKSLRSPNPLPTAEQNKVQIQRLVMKCLHWSLHLEHLLILRRPNLGFLWCLKVSGWSCDRPTWDTYLCFCGWVQLSHPSFTSRYDISLSVYWHLDNKFCNAVSMLLALINDLNTKDCYLLPQLPFSLISRK
jgi:hypothetical protein